MKARFSWAVWKQPWPNLEVVSMNFSSTASRAFRLVWTRRDWGGRRKGLRQKPRGEAAQSPRMVEASPGSRSKHWLDSFQETSTGQGSKCWAWIREVAASSALEAQNGSLVQGHFLSSGLCGGNEGKGDPHFCCLDFHEESQDTSVISAHDLGAVVHRRRAATTYGANAHAPHQNLVLGMYAQSNLMHNHCTSWQYE
uniref:Uncharacterized protein n=1 Tax=Micrurus spixii TaxID=129469 RepID=A0A2D4N756_9SAUR